jgi:DNA-binding NtrC family response regulator
VKPGFAADLLYRLNGITLQLPPLRERREEIAALAGRVRVLARPFRELRNTVECAVLLCEGGVIRARDLRLSADTTSEDLGATPALSSIQLNPSRPRRARLRRREALEQLERARPILVGALARRRHRTRAAVNARRRRRAE